MSQCTEALNPPSPIDAQRAYMREYYRRNRSRLSEWNKEYYANNREKLKAKSKAYRKTSPVHRERKRLWQRKYLRSAKGKAASARGCHRRQERSKGLPCTLTNDEWQHIIALQGGHCAICWLPFGDIRRPERDHIIPVTKGGGLTKENVQALCRPCNARKCNR